MFDFSLNIHGDISLIYWIIYSFFFFSSFIPLVLKRKKFPIKQRFPMLLLLSVVSGYLLMSNFAWEQYVGEENYPCILSHWIVWLVMPGFFLPYGLRAFRLLIMFRLNWEKSSIGVLHLDRPEPFFEMLRKNVDEEVKKSTSFIFANYKGWLLNSHYGMFVVQGLLLLVGLVRQFLVPENLPPNSGCGNSLLFFVLTTILLVSYLVGLCAAIFFMENIKDEFNISNELKIVSLSFLVFLLPYLIVEIAALLQKEETIIPTIYLILVSISISYMVSGAWPLYLSYASPSHEVTWADCDLVSSLDKTLSNNLTTLSFKKFLIQEFSIENLLFYLDIQALKKFQDLASASIFAIQVYKKYFDENERRVFDLNLDADVRRLLLIFFFTKKKKKRTQQKFWL